MAPESSERRVTLPRHVAQEASQRPVLSGLLPIAAGNSQGGAESAREPATGEYIILYCARGRGWHRSKGRTMPIAEGDLVAAPCYEAPEFGAGENGGWSIWWARAVGANLSCYLREMGVDAERPVARLGAQPQLVFLFKELLDTLADGSSSPHLLYASQTLGHLLAAAVWRLRESKASRWGAGDRVEQSIAHMSQRLDEPVQVSTLAALVNMSPSHYRVVFKRQTGLAPIDYFIRLRMNQARHLLEDSSMSVKEVAAALGYEDPFYFSRVFKSVNHVAPSDYRAARRG